MPLMICELRTDCVEAMKIQPFFHSTVSSDFNFCFYAISFANTLLITSTDLNQPTG